MLLIEPVALDLQLNVLLLLTNMLLALVLTVYYFKPNRICQNENDDWNCSMAKSNKMCLTSRKMQQWHQNSVKIGTRHTPPQEVSEIFAHNKPKLAWPEWCAANNLHPDCGCHDRHSELDKWNIFSVYLFLWFKLAECSPTAWLYFSKSPSDRCNKVKPGVFSAAAMWNMNEQPVYTSCQLTGLKFMNGFIKKDFLSQRLEERGSELQLNVCEVTIPGSVMLVSDWIRLRW